MSLYEIDAFDAFVTSLKSVTIHDQWHARVAKIGDKFFTAFLKFFLGLQARL